MFLGCLSFVFDFFKVILFKKIITKIKKLIPLLKIFFKLFQTFFLLLSYSTEASLIVPEFTISVYGSSCNYCSGYESTSLVINLCDMMYSKSTNVNL